MKRLFLILLFFSAFLLFSCGAEYGILDYQSKNIVAECQINGKYRVELKKEDSTCLITILEPKEAYGITFEIYEDIAYVSTGDVRIEMNKGDIKGICAIGEMFSQSEECLTSATEQGKGSVLTFQKEECTYQITLGEHSVPKNIKILSEAFEYNVDILSIELK